MTDAKEPERIWAYSWTGKEGRQGQWDYIDTSHYYGNVFEYIRADLYDALAKERDELAAEVVGYKEWAKDVKRLTRQLDVEMHGDGAAKQASLCDLIGSGNDMRVRAEKAEAEVERLRDLVRRAKVWFDP